MTIESIDVFNAVQALRTYTENNMPFKTTCYTGTLDPSSGLGFAANIGTLFFRTAGSPAQVISIFYKQSSANTGWRNFLISDNPQLLTIEVTDINYEIMGYVSYRVNGDILQIFINAEVSYINATTDSPIIFQLPITPPEIYTNSITSSENSLMKYVFNTTGQFELNIESDTPLNSETITAFIQIPISQNWHPI